MIMPASSDTEWIALLRSNAKVRGIARTYPMPRGATYRRKQTDTATATYQGESDRITGSNLKVGRGPALLQEADRAQRGRATTSSASPSGEADRIVQEDLLRVSALREDRAFLVGNPPTDTGSPQGIRYQTKAGERLRERRRHAGQHPEPTSPRPSASSRRGTSRSTRRTATSFMSPATYWVIYALATTTGDMDLRAGC
jgi:hypothetical protein